MDNQIEELEKESTRASIERMRLGTAAIEQHSAASAVILTHPTLREAIDATEEPK